MNKNNEEKIEKKKTGVNIGKTIINNLTNVPYVIIIILFVSLGLKIINGFESPDMKVFGLLGLAFMLFNHLRIRFVVYNSKD
jgi:small-conductance mechanosensitive channel